MKNQLEMKQNKNNVSMNRTKYQVVLLFLSMCAKMSHKLKISTKTKEMCVRQCDDGLVGWEKRGLSLL